MYFSSNVGLQVGSEYFTTTKSLRRQSVMAALRCTRALVSNTITGVCVLPVHNVRLLFIECNDDANDDFGPVVLLRRWSIVWLRPCMLTLPAVEPMVKIFILFLRPATELKLKAFFVPLLMSSSSSS